jgi:tRNA 2-selenouridine synthase
MKSPISADVTECHKFDEIIDVRTPAEFAEDHIPGALNYPVLSNQERITVGTLYKQASPFEAKKVGAALIAKRIAHYIEEQFKEKPKNWHPLIYCWRGGKRSGSMTHILRQIGWNAQILDGGYKSYRKKVVAQLNTLPQSFQYRVLTGQTGSAKSRVLEQLNQLGAQVLDLEQLANHKGSVLGNIPDSPQPSQKMFESRLLIQLQKFDSAKVVYVEAESRKIGGLHVPDVLLERMRQSPCVRIDATIEARVAYLIEDYAYFIQDPENLIRTIDYLKELHSKETLTHWKELIEAREWSLLVTELLEKHYDALYRRSQNSNYVNYEKAQPYQTADLSAKGIEILAKQILMGDHHA